MDPAKLIGALVQIAADPALRTAFAEAVAPLFVDALAVAAKAGADARAKVQTMADAVRVFTEHK